MRIKELLKEKHYTQQELADKMKCKPNLLLDKWLQQNH